jgi:hypothetical protein
MGLNHIQLTPKLVADWYPSSLIETPASHVPASKGVNILGKNEKNILIVVSIAESPYLPPEEMNFLVSILSACKLYLDDVGIVNSFSLKEEEKFSLNEKVSPKSVLLFDVSPLAYGLPIEFPPFQVQDFNKCTYVVAPSLSVIKGDVQLKKQLWNSLKKLFHI